MWHILLGIKMEIKTRIKDPYLPPPVSVDYYWYLRAHWVYSVFRFKYSIVKGVWCDQFLVQTAVCLASKAFLYYFNAKIDLHKHSFLKYSMNEDLMLLLLTQKARYNCWHDCCIRYHGEMVWFEWFSVYKSSILKWFTAGMDVNALNYMAGIYVL